jgi:hypothetical protein
MCSKVHSAVLLGGRQRLSTLSAVSVNMTTSPGRTSRMAWQPRERSAPDSEATACRRWAASHRQRADAPRIAHGEELVAGQDDQ